MTEVGCSQQLQMQLCRRGLALDLDARPCVRTVLHSLRVATVVRRVVVPRLPPLLVVDLGLGDCCGDQLLEMRLNVQHPLVVLLELRPEARAPVLVPLLVIQGMRARRYYVLFGTCAVGRCR